MTPIEPIFIIAGAPASGKSSVAKALLSYFEFGVHIPVDDLREFVISGIAHPVGWTEETTRQFRLAEQAACNMATTYNDADFAVAIDHCEAPSVLNEMVDRHLAGRRIVKVILQPSLDENLMRNFSRSGKDFESNVLIDTIRRLNPLFRSDSPDFQGWHRLDSTEWSIAQTAAEIMELVAPSD